MANLTYSRFHISTGPSSLFERVRFKISAPRRLKLLTQHFQIRAAERHAPKSLEEFDPSLWDLMTVEVRNDTGRFVNTAWRRLIENRMWWIVLGYHDAVKTVIHRDRTATGFGPKIITSGPFYDKVEGVNRGLMECEKQALATS